MFTFFCPLQGFLRHEDVIQYASPLHKARLIGPDYVGESGLDPPGERFRQNFVDDAEESYGSPIA